MLSHYTSVPVQLAPVAPSLVLKALSVHMVLEQNLRLYKAVWQSAPQGAGLGQLIFYFLVCPSQLTHGAAQ